MIYKGKRLKEIVFPLGGIGAVTAVTADGVPVSFTQTGETIAFESVTVAKELCVCNNR